MEMSEDEALKVLTRGFEGADYERLGKALCVAMNSLAGKLAAEKSKRPSLQEMEDLVRWAGDPSSMSLWKAADFGQNPGMKLKRAVEVLRFLRETLVPSLQCAVNNYAGSAMRTNPLMWAQAMLDGIEGKSPS